MEAAPPPPVQMIQMLAGFQISQALYVAAKLGVADQLLDGPRSVADLADAVGADPSSLRRLLRTLASLGVFTESEPEVFAVTPLGRTLAADEPGSMRDVALMWMETHYAPFARLLDTVKTGDTAADVHYGEPFFDWISQYPDQVGQFTGAMANLTNGIKAGAVASYDFNGVREDRRHRRRRRRPPGSDPGRHAVDDRGDLRPAPRDRRGGCCHQRTWAR